MPEVVMVDQQGRKCTAGTPEEVNNLLCEGYHQEEEPAHRQAARSAVAESRSEK